MVNETTSVNEVKIVWINEGDSFYRGQVAGRPEFQVELEPQFMGRVRPQAWEIRVSCGGANVIGEKSKVIGYSLADAKCTALHAVQRRTKKNDWCDMLNEMK